MIQNNFEHMMNKLHLMDCMEGMKQFPDKYFELAIVDPPYGDKLKKGGNMKNKSGKLAKNKNYKLTIWNQDIPSNQYFKELFRISKNQIIWGGNYFLENLKNTSCFIVFDKDNFDNDYADCELAWSSFNTATRKIKYRWSGMLQENMRQKEFRIHPTQKPIDLYRWLLINYAKKGDKILDTHVGSGSSIIACIDMGFEYCGFEIDEDYHRDATKRIEEFKSQMVLFK